MNNKTVKMIPYKIVYRICKESTDYQVSKEFVESTRNFVEEIVKQIVVESNRILEEENLIRARSGLRKRGRIDQSLFLNLPNKVFIHKEISGDGDAGNCSVRQTTALSKADEVISYVR